MTARVIDARRKHGLVGGAANQTVVEHEEGSSSISVSVGRDSLRLGHDSRRAAPDQHLIVVAVRSRQQVCRYC